MTETVTEDIELLEYCGIHSAAVRDLLFSLKRKNDVAKPLELGLDLDKNDNDCQVTIQPPLPNVRLKRSKLNRMRQLSWNPLVEREATPEIKREWLAFQLRGFVDPKKFIKRGLTKKIEPIPAKFDVGTMVGDSKLAVGGGNESQAAGAINSKKRPRGKWQTTQLLAGDLEWTKKKYREIQAKHTSGSKGWYARNRKSKVK